MAANVPRPHEQSNTGSENILPGATRKAADRHTNPPRRGPSRPDLDERGLDEQPRTYDDQSAGEGSKRQPQPPNEQALPPNA